MIKIHVRVDDGFGAASAKTCTTWPVKVSIGTPAQPCGHERSQSIASLGVVHHAKHKLTFSGLSLQQVEQCYAAGDDVASAVIALGSGAPNCQMLYTLWRGCFAPGDMVVFAVIALGSGSLTVNWKQ